MKKHLIEYIPPAWVKGLNHVPKYRVELTAGITPLHEWTLPGVPEEFTVGIKRHDMTGCTLSGNKVEKLEFLLADAIATGCKHVITCGSPLSNLCRATSLACRQLGLEPHLFLMTNVKKTSELGCYGNLMFNRLAGANMYLVPVPKDEPKEVYPRMQALADRIMEEKGEKSYFIPKGASNTVGLFGSMSVMEQLQKQGAFDEYDDVVLPCGSSGTVAGVCIANYLTGAPFRVHGVVINYDKEFVHRHVNQELRALGLDDVRSEDILDVIDNYLGEGYSKASQEQLDFMLNVGTTTGVILDPTYTGKAAWGLKEELRTNPSRFKGRRVLFIHTGGIYGIFDGRMDDLVVKPDSSTNRVTMWSDFKQDINGDNKTTA